MDGPKTLQAAIKHYSDEQVCIEAVARMRWPKGPECPACLALGDQKHYYLKTQKRWKCKECYKQFTVKLGTVFEDSPISLTKWLPALWMLVNCKNGISSYELHRALGVSQKAAWFMLQRLRLALQDGSIMKLGGSGSEVEVDETFVGAKARNMHKSRKDKIQQARSHVRPSEATMSDRYLAKTAVMGMLDREARKVRAAVVPNVRRSTLQAKILNEVEHGSKLYTDQAIAYDGLASTNGIENFWSLLKRGLNGTYVAVEPFHLFRYVDEQVFRFNNRNTKEKPMNDADRFQLALSQVAGKRLTFAEVTGKVGETKF